MLVHIIYVMAVVVHSLLVIESYHIPTNRPDFFFTHPLIFCIGGYQHNYTAFPFHSKYMKNHIVKITVKCIHGPNIHIIEVSLDLLDVDIVRPVSPLLGESVSI